MTIEEATDAIAARGLELLQAIDPEQDESRFIVRPAGTHGGIEFPDLGALTAWLAETADRY